MLNNLDTDIAKQISVSPTVRSPTQKKKCKSCFQDMGASPGNQEQVLEALVNN